MRQVERERKFEIERGRRVPELPGYVLGERRRQRLVAVYVDTPDLRLTRARITLRRRTGGDDAGWHLKLPGSGEDRIEVHAPLAEGPVPARVPARLRAEVADLVGKRPLVPVAEMRTARTEREIRTGRGRLVGTLTDDTVRVGSWRRSGEPTDQQIWRELEVELADGSRANREALEDITRKLAEQQVPVALASSKVGRFLAARVNAVARAEAATEDPTTEEAITVVLDYIGTQLGVIQKREADVVDDAPDAVHKTRVATRRLRSALRTGRRLFDAEVTEPLRMETRWWGKVLGGPRDAEVFRELMLASLDELPADKVVGPIQRRIRDELDRTHARTHAAAVRTMGTRRYNNLLDALADLVVNPPLRPRATDPAHQVHPRLVRRAVERMEARQRIADEAPHSERPFWLHETRKKAKALRYLGESLAPIHGKTAKEMAARYENVTEKLGDLQDAMVAVERLRAMRQRAARAGEPTTTYDELIRRQHAQRGVAEAEGEEALEAAGDAADPLEQRAYAEPVSDSPVPPPSVGPDFRYSDLLPTHGSNGAPETPYRLITTEGVSTFEATVDGESRTFLKVEPEAIRRLTAEAMRDIAHYLRPGHLAQLRRIIDDPEASGNDRFVATDLLRNVCISAGGVLPMCQDTGTAIVMGKKSEGVITGADDGEAISQGVYEAYTRLNLRYSQMAPLTTYEEKNTGNNLPAQIEVYSTPEGEHGPEYKFLFMAKGGGSANKSFLFQETKAVLNPTRLLEFLDEKIRSLGTAACPPYHLAVVIGGTSAEFALKTAKYASAHYLDDLPTSGDLSAHGFRDPELEEKVFELTQSFGIGAQFGGKYFCHDVRVVRLPRHGASCPVALAVSCSADRQALGKITPEGVFLEQLETDPAHYLPETTDEHLDETEAVPIDLKRPMPEILAELSRHPVKTRLSLTGPLVVARDIAHARIAERLEAGEEMPQYLKDHPVYYAGPAKTPEGYASGSFGPTTAGRMDSYVDRFQAAGGSMVMLAKGNRSKQVVDACAKHGGFYLGSIGGPAARLAQDCIKAVEVLEYEELGMEAIWRIEVEDFPAFIVMDDKGNDFFADPSGEVTVPLSGIRVRSREQ